MPAKINYQLNGGYWAPKYEVKEAFYTDFYHFVQKYYQELNDIDINDFFSLEPYIIGNMLGKYFLKEEVGGKLEDQPQKYFIGYCYHNRKYIDLILHLIKFFALWREIERCSEPHATDFFASSWASLVDTAKFFKYTTIEELKNSPEAPSVQDQRILDMLQNCPGSYDAPQFINPKEDLRLPKPRRDNFTFIGYYDNPEFNGEIVKYASCKITEDVTYYARWATYTYFHSNDGYASFDDLYSDFLKDFSQVIGREVGKSIERIEGHGPVSEFCKASYHGGLNKFFSNPKYHQKWWWLIEYFQSLKKNNPEILKRFDYSDGKFNSEAQVRWELNSLFVSRFHLVWPKTGDYSGLGIKEKLADATNSKIVKVKYPLYSRVDFPKLSRKGYTLVGYYDSPKFQENMVTEIIDERYANKTLYAKWQKD